MGSELVSLTVRISASSFTLCHFPPAQCHCHWGLEITMLKELNHTTPLLGEAEIETFLTSNPYFSYQLLFMFFMFSCLFN